MTQLEDGGSSTYRRIARLGVASWSAVGTVVLLGMAIGALGALSEIVLPLLFAVVLAVVFRPLARRLRARGLPRVVATLAIVIGLIAFVSLAAVLLVRAVAAPVDEIALYLERALVELAGLAQSAGVGDPTEAAAEGVRALGPMIQFGFPTLLIGGIPTAVAFVGSAVLGVLIMYYLLKDDETISGWLVGQLPPAMRGDGQALLDESAGTLQAYARGRTVLAALVAAVVGLAAALLGVPMVGTIVVVNFVGGYVPYLGAFAGGSLAALLALADGGIVPAVVMVIIVVAANLMLENLVEPTVMGRRLDLHPLAVLILTTLGGVLGGIVGLILAVPLALILGRVAAYIVRMDLLGSVATRVPRLGAVPPTDKPISRQ